MRVWAEPKNGLLNIPLEAEHWSLTAPREKRSALIGKVAEAVQPRQRAPAILIKVNKPLLGAAQTRKGHAP